MPDLTPEAQRLAKVAQDAIVKYRLRAARHSPTALGFREAVARALDEACIRKLVETLEAGVRPMSGTMPVDACEQALKLLRGDGT